MGEHFLLQVNGSCTDVTWHHFYLVFDHLSLIACIMLLSIRPDFYINLDKRWHGGGGGDKYSR